MPVIALIIFITGLTCYLIGIWVGMRIRDING